MKSLMLWICCVLLVGQSGPNSFEAQRIRSVVRSTPRHLFVPDSLRAEAESGQAVRISSKVMVPSPQVALRMLEMLRPAASDRVLEVGTGSGYLTALLAQLAARVYTVEPAPEVLNAAKPRLNRLGYNNVEFLLDDRHRGWEGEAPYHRILLTTAPREVPPALIEQLAPGGRLVAAVGPPSDQVLVLAEKKRDGTLAWSIGEPVSLVPDSSF